MMARRSEFSRRYRAALQEYVKQGASAALDIARSLGGEAVALELETLDFARIHEISLISPLRPGSSILGATPGFTAGPNKVSMARASLFFAEVLGPIEQTHRGAREANIHLGQLVKLLSQRTSELAESVTALRASERTASEHLENSLGMQAQLRDLSSQLLSVQEDERRKISRELHDVIAQTLTGINLRLAAMTSVSMGSPEQFSEHITRTQKLVSESVDIVHRFACDLRPTVLDDLGLVPALKAFMERFMRDTGVRTTLVFFAGIDQAGGAISTVLYRVAQEALNNVARHAGASRADIRIRGGDGSISMEVKDDGQGFEVNHSSCASKKGRLGLLGMRERVEMIGGTFFVESSPGNPTTVRVEVPVRDRAMTPDLK